MAASEHWRLAGGGILLRQWDGQFVVYDRYSGETHCLSRLASRLVAHIATERSATTADLAGLVNAYGEPSRAEAEARVALGELERLHVLRCGPE